MAEAIGYRIRNESDGQDKDGTWRVIYLKPASQWEERVQEKLRSWETEMLLEPFMEIGNTRKEGLVDTDLIFRYCN